LAATLRQRDFAKGVSAPLHQSYAESGHLVAICEMEMEDTEFFEHLWDNVETMMHVFQEGGIVDEDGNLIR
jgi:hypothetical protein